MLLFAQPVARLAGRCWSHSPSRVICFLLVQLSTDIATAMAGEGARSEDIENIRKQYGFDRPLVGAISRVARPRVRRAISAISSISARRSPSIVWERMGTTLSLGAMALSFALALSIPLGVAAAVRPNSWIDRLTLTVAVIGQAMPPFWFALLLILFFGAHPALAADLG